MSSDIAKDELRSELIELFGADNVWDTTELQRDFKVISFFGPGCTVVERKSDGQKGVVSFEHDPRLYFNFIST